MPGKKTTYQYDKAGRVASVSDNGKTVAEYSYYEDGNLQQVRFANGIYTEYIYNADRNYKNITTKTAEGEILLDYSYQYDGNGTRISKAGSGALSRHLGNDSVSGNTTYTYDNLQRLQQVRYSTGTMEQYAYDNAGNRILRKYGNIENFKTGNYLEERYRYDNRNCLLERKNPQDVTYYPMFKKTSTTQKICVMVLQRTIFETCNSRYGFWKMFLCYNRGKSGKFMGNSIREKESYVRRSC